MFDLSGRTALVTGASGGIGEAVARTLYAAGANLVVAGTREDRLRAIADELGARACVAAADLAEPAAADLLLRTGEEAFGGVDILVNNAGLTRDGLAVRMRDEDWSRVLDVNLGAAFRLSRAALKGMMKRRYGRIIAVTSVVGTIGNAGQANYAASKGGLVAMSKSLAAEVGSRGITVNCVAPGFIETPMTEGLAAGTKERAIAAIPAGRFGAPADVAAAILFLASSEAAYVTGQTLHVNGGMAMI